MSANTISTLGRSLFDAERARTARLPISQEFPDLGPEMAYAVQEAYADLRQKAGAGLVGRKIGATSRAIQDLFGIDTPDFGHIFDDMVVPDAGSIARAELIQPMVEPELAFILSRDLKGPGVSRADVLAATDYIVPCLEIIDSRIIDWQISFVDTVADNGSSARCVFGALADPYPAHDLAAVRARMSRNGVLVGEATGEAVLGHPADAVAWLVNALAEYDRGIHAGEHVLSGSFMTAARAEAGDHFEATFGDFGSVSINFI